MFISYFPSLSEYIFIFFAYGLNVELGEYSSVTFVVNMFSRSSFAFLILFVI